MRQVGSTLEAKIRNDKLLMIHRDYAGPHVLCADYHLGRRKSDPERIVKLLICEGPAMARHLSGVFREVDRRLSATHGGWSIPQATPASEQTFPHRLRQRNLPHCGIVRANNGCQGYLPGCGTSLRPPAACCLHRDGEVRVDQKSCRARPSFAQDARCPGDFRPALIQDGHRTGDLALHT
jgi:hypothetical protein